MSGMAVFAAESDPVVLIEDGRGNIVAEMTPDDARALARDLLSVADYADNPTD